MSHGGTELSHRSDDRRGCSGEGAIPRSHLDPARLARPRRRIVLLSYLCLSGVSVAMIRTASGRGLKGWRASGCRGRLVTRAAGRRLAVRSLAIRSSVCRNDCPLRADP